MIDTRVRPAVANDGGDIIFRSFEDGVVYLHMQGSCSGLPQFPRRPSSTIRANMLRDHVPEVQAVEAVD